jgi:predicted phosphodiesterase
LRYAILSDIHGNLEAFQAVLKDLTAEGLQKIIFLGDVVGYGANPKECIDLLREKSRNIVAGNHDWGVAGKTDTSNFNSAARMAIEWTISQLNPEYKGFLAQLPLKRDEEDFTYTHSTPINPQEWHYIFSEHEALRNINGLEQKLCFIGHSHIPVVFALNQFGELLFTTDCTKIIVDEKTRFLINVGSVGQPRDSNPQAAYGILDTEKQVFFLRRVSYDIARAQKKILSAGLPPVLAERISKGW